MKRSVSVLVLLFSISALAVGGCSRGLTTARGVVKEFLDHHYVHIDLEKAQQYCVGLALHKVKEEIRLTHGYAIDASTRKPKIYYQLLEEKVTTARASFLYQATIQAEDAPEFTRRWLIGARKENEQWRISNFKEY